MRISNLNVDNCRIGQLQSQQNQQANNVGFTGIKVVDISERSLKKCTSDEKETVNAFMEFAKIFVKEKLGDFSRHLDNIGVEIRLGGEASKSKRNGYSIAIESINGTTLKKNVSTVKMNSLKNVEEKIIEMARASMKDLILHREQVNQNLMNEYPVRLFCRSRVRDKSVN